MLEQKAKYVDWFTFVWVVGIVSFIIAGLATLTITLAAEISELKSNISGIRSEVSLISKGVDRINSILDNKFLSLK